MEQMEFLRKLATESGAPVSMQLDYAIDDLRRCYQKDKAELLKRLKDYQAMKSE